MRILLTILLTGLLLVLVVALGTEVVALHHADPPSLAPPVVVRKSTTAPVPPKLVRRVRPRLAGLPKHQALVRWQAKAPAR